MFEYLIKAISRTIGFTKTESKGTLVLIFIIISSLFISNARIKYLKNQPTTVPDSTDIAWIAEVQASYDLKKEESIKKRLIVKPKKKYPNFDKKEYNNARPASPEVTITINDINLATAEELQKVRGIGPAFSERIIKYRDLLGGFADTIQFKEVYGLKPETISNLKERFQIMSPVVRIDLNSDSISHLSKHPYISYDLARIIINYRNEHGEFNAPEELKEIKIIDDQTFMRLKPYLD